MSESFPAHSADQARLELMQGISILERLGIIDFNGHFSVRMKDGDILINTGSSVRSHIKPADFVRVGPDGRLHDGAPRPPAELPLHLSIYRARPDVSAVVHGHPKWSTFLTCAGRDYQVTMAQGALLDPVAQFRSPRSINISEIADEVARTLGDGRALLLKAHGSVVAATDVKEATVLAIYLELNSERQFNAALVGDPYVFTPEEIAACKSGLMKSSLFEKCWNYYLEKFGLSASQQ